MISFARPAAWCSCGRTTAVPAPCCGTRIDYRHPRRPSTRVVPAGETVRLRRGESVSLTGRGASVVTYDPR